MKSFSQFLQESYLNEEPAGRPARRRTGGPSPEEVKKQIDAREAEKAAKAAARQPSGAAANPQKYGFKSTKVSSPATPSAPTASTPGAQLRTDAETIAQQAKARANQPGEQLRRDAERIANQARQNTRSSAATLPTPSGGTASGGKPPTGPKLKVPSGLGKVGRVAGKLVGPASAALDVADERSKGSGWARSLAKGAAVAVGGALGGAAGSVVGPVGSVGGAVGGSMAASKAFDVAAGANAKERAAMATANRQRQAGTAIKGIGGKTTFDTKKNTMTTGTGSQKKTVALAKTGVVQRGGQSTTGYLAYKGGKAVYKAGPSAQSLAKTSSNPLERIGRSLFAGAYKQSDAANAAKKLAAARQSDAARNKALGVKMKPGG